MLSSGAVEDVEQAIELGASRTARKAIGFAEIEAHVAGELSLEEARDRIARRHRQYAKRQLTWMRKLAGVKLLDRTEMNAGETALALLDCIAH
jgi:tRNA dimethylallyltransferase